MKCTKGWLFYGFPQKNYNQGSHAGNKGYHNGHCQSGNFPQLLISMVLETRKSLFTFLVLFSYCPCDNAINNGQDTNGNGDESDESCRNKSSVRFHVVECRSPIQYIYMSLSIEIKRRLPMETTKETSGRKWASLHRMFPSSHGRSTFQELDPEMISTIFTVMTVKGLKRSDTAMLKTK